MCSAIHNAGLGLRLHLPSCAPALQNAPPLFALPPLGNTLDSSPAMLAAAAPAAAPKKAVGGKGGKQGGGAKGKGKKGVKFAEGADDDRSAGRSGGGATSQHTTSGGGAATHSGSTAQAGGQAATQAAATAAGGGLGRLDAERWKQRSLLLPALSTLAIGAEPSMEAPCYAALPTAAYVLADLLRQGSSSSRVPCRLSGRLAFAGQAGLLTALCALGTPLHRSKLKPVLAAAKGPGFPGRPAKQLLPADLASLTAAELLEALAPVLPSIRRHLDAGGRAPALPACLVAWPLRFAACWWLLSLLRAMPPS